MLCKDRQGGAINPGGIAGYQLVVDLNSGEMNDSCPAPLSRTRRPGQWPDRGPGRSSVPDEMRGGCTSKLPFDAGQPNDRDGASTRALAPSLFVSAKVMSRPVQDRAIVS